MDGMNVLLVIGGGIAAYKTPQLVRDLGRRGVACRIILTRGGANFVSPLTLSAVSGEKVFQDLFDLTDEAEMGHIQLSRSADLILVAPATANLMAKVAHGIADDLATTCILATDTPVVMCPAMNVRMWESSATQANLATLRARGVGLIGPDAGDMACGEHGDGRMSEPGAIADAVAARLRIQDLIERQDLAGRRAVVTAGPTVEPIDPVRFVSNRSSGKQGYAVAKALAARGAEVVLVSGPTALPAPPGVARVEVETAREMLAAVVEALEENSPTDIFVGVAAVADWAVAEPAATKLKKSRDGAPNLAWTENPDILKTVSHHARRPALVIGFAAETNDVSANAQAKLARKGCDWIVANDVSPGPSPSSNSPSSSLSSSSLGSVFGADRNRVSLLRSTAGEDGTDREGSADWEDWPSLSKAEVGRRLAARIAGHFEAARTS